MGRRVGDALKHATVTRKFKTRQTAVHHLKQKHRLVGMSTPPGTVVAGSEKLLLS
jgi:hypothetical protein